MDTINRKSQYSHLHPPNLPPQTVLSWATFPRTSPVPLLWRATAHPSLATTPCNPPLLQGGFTGWSFLLSIWEWPFDHLHDPWACKEPGCQKSLYPGGGACGSHLENLGNIAGKIFFNPQLESSGCQTDGNDCPFF